jgi:hypothetical protein
MKNTNAFGDELLVVDWLHHFSMLRWSTAKCSSVNRINERLIRLRRKV